MLAVVTKVLDDDDLLAEILLRVGLPTTLVRAAAVCRGWRAILSDPGFARGYRALHGAPPMLGFLYNYRSTDDEGAPYWTSHFRAAAALPQRVRRDRKHWRALDSRHGLVLFHTPKRDVDFVICDLVTYDRWRIDAAPECAEIIWNREDEDDDEDAPSRAAAPEAGRSRAT